MSYTFNNRGGTNYGIKTYNQVFAKNRKTVGASNYWDPTLISGDTVICEMSYTHAGDLIKDHKLLTWYDFDQYSQSQVYGSHWIGAGIYLCYDSDGNGWEIGDFLCCPLTEMPTAAGARPSVVKATSVAEAERPMGVALEDCNENGFATIAMMGLWPVKRNGTLGRSEAIYSRTDGSGEVDDAPIGTYKNGAFGKAIDPDFDIITSTSATPSTVDGAQVCIWGTAAEIF